MEEVVGSHRMGVLRLAKEYGAHNVRVFGSVRRREATAASDLDLLVDWDARSGLLDLVRFRRDVEALLERPVDVVEACRLHWALRPIVLAEAVPL